MMATDSDALICDLAETYQIYDARAFPVRRIAVFSCGLRADSRIMRKLSGVQISQAEALQAGILDAVNTWLWMNSRSGTPRPDSVLARLTSETPVTDTPESFGSPEEFEAVRARLLEEG